MFYLILYITRRVPGTQEFNLKNKIKWYENEAEFFGEHTDYFYEIIQMGCIFFFFKKNANYILKIL